MSIAKIVWLVSALAAVALAFVDTGYDGSILAILGLASGWFLDGEHRRGVILAATFLILAGSGSVSGIEGIGDALGKIVASIGAVFGAASVMAIIRTMVERIFSKSAA